MERMFRACKEGPVRYFRFRRRQTRRRRTTDSTRLVKQLDIDGVGTLFSSPPESADPCPHVTPPRQHGSTAAVGSQGRETDWCSSSSSSSSYCTHWALHTVPFVCCCGEERRRIRPLAAICAWRQGWCGGGGGGGGGATSCSKLWKTTTTRTWTRARSERCFSSSSGCYRQQQS